MWPMRLQMLGQIFFQLCSMQITAASFHTRRYEAEHIKHSSQFDYLNQKQPLWVLDDEVQSTERDIDRITTFTTTERPNNPAYYFKYRQNKMLPQVGFYKKSHSKLNPSKQIKRLYLPENYLYGDHKSFKFKHPEPRFWRRQQPVSIPLAQDDFTPSMPIFDSAPTDIDASDVDRDDDDDEVHLAPMFVYNGPKGQLIMNTMLSTHRYPMHEPVPGQILYPPIEPIFRPKPIVQSFRMPGRAEPLNLTLIPFYAHEAIVPRFMFDSYSKAASTAASSSLLAASETTTANVATATVTRSPAVLYAAAAPAPAPPPPLTSSTTSTTTPNLQSKSTTSKKRRHKKAKKYAVYRSADEVHWRPTEPSKADASTATTSFPMVLASPLQNHRFNIIDDGYYGYDVTTTTPTTTPKISSTTTKTTIPAKPMKNFKLTYKDEDSQFQIVYVDESLEKPTAKQVEPTRAAAVTQRLQRLSTPKPLPLISSHYSSDKEYYAFPVYTLGKLLRPDNAERPISHASHSSVYRKQHQPESTKDFDTWFIMNSRYKGQQSSENKSKKLSSKYVEIGSPYDAIQSAEEMTETTIEKAMISK